MNRWCDEFSAYERDIDHTLHRVAYIVTPEGATVLDNKPSLHVVIVPDFKVLIRGAGYYRDRYRRESDGAWRIAETSYERIYESMQSLDDTPSFKLVANRWAAPEPG